MAKPNGSIKQISSSVDNSNYEIIPHRLTDGTNLVSLPEMDDDKTLVVSDDDMVIPAVPTQDGTYCMAFTVSSGSKILSWQTLTNTVTYVPVSNPSATPNLVFADENRASGALNLVYQEEEQDEGED